jgi:hypothetical protein
MLLKANADPCTNSRRGTISFVCGGLLVLVSKVLTPEQTVRVTMWGDGKKPDLAHEWMRGSNRIELEGT